MQAADKIPGLNSPELTDIVLSNYAEGKGPFTPSDSARALSVFRAIVDRLHRAEDRLFDACLQNDGPIFSEAERYLAEHRPDLKALIDSYQNRSRLVNVTLTVDEVTAIMRGHPVPALFDIFTKLRALIYRKSTDAKSFEKHREAVPAEEQPTCKTCVFSFLGTQGDPNEGLCRRFPPQMVPVPGQDTAGPLWAEITADDWCGEHKGSARGAQQEGD